MLSHSADECITYGGHRRRRIQHASAARGDWLPAGPIWRGLFIGLILSTLQALMLPLMFGVCFFIIGSESHPVGLVLFASCAALVIVFPILGLVVGVVVHLKRRVKGKV